MNTDERRARAIAKRRQEYWAKTLGGDHNAYLGWNDFAEYGKSEGIEEARAIRASDEAAGMVLVPRDMVQQAHALLAQIMSAGHNAPGPTQDDIQGVFWRLDNLLAAGGDDADV